MNAYLEPGEEVRVSARPHGAALVRPLGRSLLLGLIGAIVVTLGSPLHWTLGAVGVAVLVFAAARALRAVWRWDRTAVILTSEKILVVDGIARRRAAAVRLDRAGTLEFEQGLAGRLLGYGTLVAGNMEIPYVPQPRELIRLMQ